MTYRPPIPISIPVPAPLSTTPSTAAQPTSSSSAATPTAAPTATGAPPSATETRTLLTFPTEGLPSPLLLSQANLRAFPVRYPSGAAPAQTQINRWLCCRCAEEGYLDPVGMVHCPSSSSSSPLPGTSSHHHGQGYGHGPTPNGASHHHHHITTTTTTATDRGGAEEEEGLFNTCWRATYRHRKCVNCALYAGPLGRADPAAKLLIRTVGGLYASPRFVDPVHWECGGCGEWARNRFDSRCALGVTGCRGEGCVFAWRAGRARVVGGGGGGGGGIGGMGFGMGVVAGNGLGLGPGSGGGFGDGAAIAGTGAGVLTGQTVVMNRYGERLGTADQRIAVADGPWDWQRRALGDARCGIVAGLRAAMKRTGEGMQFDSGVNGSRRMCEVGRLWKDGEPVPHYPYRRPPPVDENDVEENNEYEGSYLAGMPTEPSGKGKGLERQYTSSSSHSPRSCSAPSPVVMHSVALNLPPAGFFSGWNHLQM